MIDIKIGVALKSKDECACSESRTASASPTQQRKLKLCVGIKRSNSTITSGFYNDLLKKPAHCVIHLFPRSEILKRRRVSKSSLLL